MAWLYQRKTTVTALGITVAVSLVLNLRSPSDGEFLARYALSTVSVQSLYLALLAALLPLMIFEPAIRRLVRRPPCQWLIAGGASLIAFFIFQLLIPVQEKRLFDMPFSLWLILVHIVALCVLVVILVTDEPESAPDRRLTRIAFVIFVTLGLITATLSIASVGEFMRMDTPDEPWTASIATTFAEEGRLTSTYLASVYGDPDIVFPRGYYLLMGLWSRIAGSSDLATLRLFPLAVGVLVIAVVLIALRHQPAITSLGKMAVVLSLLGSPTFLRTTHNLRMDIMLALYAACVLWGVLRFFDAQERKHWAVMLGASLLIGTQGIPPVALSMGMAVGVILLVWSAQDFKSRWVVVALYAGSSALALLVYCFTQLLPDLPTNLNLYLQFTTHYTGATGLGSIKLPFVALGNMVRFSLALSPVALGFSLLALLVLLWRGLAGERAIIQVMVLTLAIVSLFFNVAFAYFVVFAPLAAYAVGRLLRWRITVMLSAFVLFPALLSPPIHDLWRSIHDRPNSRMVANDQALISLILEDTALVADDRLWFTLHQHRTFIGWNGLSSIRREEQRTMREALLSRGVELVICSTEYQSRCDAIIETGMFMLSQELPTAQETYYIYTRQSS
ncbi:MAG: hypothetical protein HZC41_15225 [Chloroflexi bacterium]|nr:hypothetical protein [Chloroflexota bacterium]